MSKYFSNISHQWQNNISFRKRLMRHLTMWLAIWLLYNIDLITAWAAYGTNLSCLTVSACMVSVYLSLPFSQKFIFNRLDEPDFELSNQYLFRFSRRIILHATIGSIFSFLLSIVINFDKNNFYGELIKESALFHTTWASLNDIGQGKEPQYLVRRLLDMLNGDTNKTAFLMAFIRNIPEALSTTAVFLLWEAMIVLERQSVKIEKNRLLKDALSHTDWIHALMNTFFAQTDDLKKIAQRLEGQNKIDLDKTTQLQEDIGNLQRFRLSIIRDNENLVSLHYEEKALHWMKNIVKIKNPNITFQEDFEDIEENKYWIVPIILSELLWNAYKHSGFEDGNKKIYIPIGLAIVDSKIKFYIENPIGDKKGRSSGTGTKTIRKRLELEYGKNNFNLDVSKKQNADKTFNYIVKLELPLKNK